MEVPAHALAALRTYANARRRLLADMKCAISCRDPLAEFAEWAAALLLDAVAAPSRVQRGFDLMRRDGRRVQVKYLANTCGERWVNEHTITFSDNVEQYALVVYEGFDLTAIVVFDKGCLEQVGRRLAKRHPNQHMTLQFTRMNFLAIKNCIDEFASMGVAVWLPTSSGERLKAT